MGSQGIQGRGTVGGVLDMTDRERSKKSADSEQAPQNLLIPQRLHAETKRNDAGMQCPLLHFAWARPGSGFRRQGPALRSSLGIWHLRPAERPSCSQPHS